MKKITPPTKVYVAKSRMKGGGRGVFAAGAIKKGETIEFCPVIVVKGKDVSLLRRTILRSYYFIWEKNKPSNKLATTVAVVLGFGGIYNHSPNPNATKKKHFKEEVVEFVALRNIKKGEEVTHSYSTTKSQMKIWI